MVNGEWSMRARHGGVNGWPRFIISNSYTNLTISYSQYCRKSVYVLIIDIHSRFFAHGSKPLLAIRRHPDGIALFYRIPLMIEHIHPLTLQIQQTMFHDMGLYKRQMPAG